MKKNMTEEQMKMLIDGLAEQMVKRIYGLEKERDQAVVMFSNSVFLS